MPEIPVRPATKADKAKNVVLRTWDLFLNSAALAAVLVALTAFVIHLLGISFGSVAAAFLIVFAGRLSQKRIAPQVTMQEAPRRPTPTKDLLKPKDPLEALTP